MQKIVFSITKLKKGEQPKRTGQGFISDTDLLIPMSLATDKACIKVFEDVTKYCYPVLNSLNEFKGAYTAYKTVEVETKDGSKEMKEIAVDYFIWYKLVD